MNNLSLVRCELPLPLGYPAMFRVQVAGVGIEPTLVFAVAVLSLKLTLNSARLCKTMMRKNAKRFKVIDVSHNCERSKIVFSGVFSSQNATF